MDLHFTYTRHLTSEQLKNIEELFEDIEFSSIEQYPGFSEHAYPGEKTIHALLTSGDKLLGYAQIRIKKKVIASIYFGPLVKKQEYFFLFIQDIKKHLKKKLLLILNLYPPFFSKEYPESTWDDLKKKTKYETYENYFNWATQLVSLSRTEEEILKSFEYNHRYSIKKADKDGLTTELLSLGDIPLFNEQFCEMYRSRKIKINEKTNFKKFTGIFNFFEKNKKGFFLGVKHKNDLVGGVCVAFGNNVGFYLAGYAHPDYRKFCITHLALFDAMKYLRDNGLGYFDMGGYALNAEGSDQLFQINKFKEGFNGELVLYPKTLLYYLRSPAKLLSNAYALIKN